MTDDLLLVLINYNEPKNTVKLIKNITKIKDFKKIKKILILNNGAELVELKELETVGIWIENKTTDNNGFGAALNIGIQEAINLNVKYIWSLNIDVEIFDDTLSELLKLISEDKIVGSVIHDKYKNTFIYQYGTNGLDTWRGYRKVEPSNESEILVDAVAGTSMLIGRNIFSQINFDEEYFMYVEENDYCYTAKLYGFRSYMCTNSIVLHESGASFNDKSIRWYYKVRNLLKFKNKFWKNNNAILIIYLFLVTFKIYGFSYSYLKKYLRAIVDYKKKVYGKYK